jgi:hypothetical protein
VDPARSTRRTDEHQSFDALVEENKQLRELVVHLSEIVIRKALDR